MSLKVRESKPFFETIFCSSKNSLQAGQIEGEFCKEEADPRGACLHPSTIGGHGEVAVNGTNRRSWFLYMFTGCTY